MDREDIIRMAREAGMQLAWIATVPDTNKMKVLCDFDQVQRFAALVAAAEREACVQIIEEYQIPVGNSPAGELACEWTYDALKEIRDDIRARGNT
jgi:hypothetical protein